MDLRIQHNLKEIVVMLILVVLILLVYGQVQDYEFIDYDDKMYVVDNYRIQQGITLRSITDTFKDIHTSNWHPLTMMSHMLDWQLFGDNAGGHHWTSVIIHILNTILLFLFFRYLTGAVWRSAFIAALFAIHPLNVESVAWIAERKNVLSTFFWILTMFFYVWYVQSPNWRRYVFVFISLALGLMSKPMLVTLPFVLLLLDYWPLQRITFNSQNEGQRERASPLPIKQTKISSLIIEKIPLFVLISISSFVTFYAAQYVGVMTSLDTLPISSRIGNAIVSYVLYIKKVFWPIDLSVLSPLSDKTIFQISIAFILLAGITILVLKYSRKYPYLFVGWFWYLGTLVPVIGLVHTGFLTMSDRYAYVSFIGLFIMITWGVSTILSKIKTHRLITLVTALAAAFIIVLFIFGTYNQIKFWRDTVTLFENDLRNNPDNYMACTGLGRIAAGKNDDKTAFYYYYRALKINPKHEPAYICAGVLLLKKGKIEDAIRNYKKALEINRNSALSEFNLGGALVMKNELNEAILHFRRALELDPDYINTYNNLAAVLLWTGRTEEAIICFNKALQLTPNNGQIQKNMKIAIAMQGKKSHAGHGLDKNR